MNKNNNSFAVANSPFDEIRRGIKRAERQIDKARLFVNHVKNHFSKDHPDWKVKCKICNKTIDEIYQEKKSVDELTPNSKYAEIAFKMSKVVHDNCIGAPHDIGLTIMEAIKSDIA